MMNPTFLPSDWFWIVAGDDSQAWSSAVGAFVSADGIAADRVSRIGTLGELDEVLRRLGLISPVITADDVRAEASRRMQALVGARDAQHLQIVIANASREAIRLLRIKEDRAWTSEEAQRAAQLEAADAMIEAIRAASNTLEVMSPVPADYHDAARWP